MWGCVGVCVFCFGLIMIMILGYTYSVESELMRLNVPGTMVVKLVPVRSLCKTK